MSDNSKETKDQVAQKSDTQQTKPIVVSLGKTKKRKIKKIKRGGGPLLDHVDDAVDYARSSMGDSAKDKVFVPVVLIYRQKESKPKSNGHPWTGSWMGGN